MRVFRLRDEDGVRDGWKLVKDDNNMSEHIKKCTRARFAETSTFKNKFIQFYDLLGREEATDYHTGVNVQTQIIKLTIKTGLNVIMKKTSIEHCRMV